MGQIVSESDRQISDVREINQGVITLKRALHSSRFQPSSSFVIISLVCDQIVVGFLPVAKECWRRGIHTYAYIEPM